MNNREIVSCFFIHGYTLQNYDFRFIKALFEYTMIFIRIFGEYSILPRREYAAYNLLQSILSITALSSLTGAFFPMFISQFNGITSCIPFIIAV